MSLSRIIFLPSLLFFMGCDNNGGSGTAHTNPPAATIGTWVGKTDIESLSHLINADGTCKEITMSEATDLGKFYLEAFKIEPTGALMELATIKISSSDHGDFINKGQVDSDGKVTINPTLLKQLAKQGTVFKSYNHVLSAKDDTLIYTIKHQEVFYEGQTWTLNDSTDEFIRVTDSDFFKYISQAKSCTKNQKLKP